jgi:SAM-dependent methyltransferase
MRYDLMEKSDFSSEELVRMSMLEIGGTMIDQAFIDIQLPQKISLDPVQTNRKLYSDDSQLLEAIGEHIPIKSGSIDLCYCGNTIDHTNRPLSVLNEIRRVLTGHGVLVISCNVLSPWARPAFPLFDVIERPHPHHYTLASFKKLLSKAGFKSEIKSVEGRPIKRKWKVAVGALFGLRLVTLRCVPRHDEQGVESG